MVDIIKASGEKEKFSKEKLRRSLKRAGVESKLADRVCREITKTVRPGVNSGEVLERVTRCLKEENPLLAARYNLKRAIMDLGPTGFPFEEYVAAILKEYGYATRVGKQVRGHCVTHEVDVVAQKEDKHFMIECKYHNSRGVKSDVRVALYTLARFLDIKKEWEKLPGHQNFFHQAWLVTNTKCTGQALQYAKCAGLKVISWRYPRNESLEYLIEKKGLYPITILPSLNRYARERLAQQRIMLAKDLLKYSADDLVRTVGLQPNIVQGLQEEAKEL